MRGRGGAGQGGGALTWHLLDELPHGGGSEPGRYVGGFVPHRLLPLVTVDDHQGNVSIATKTIHRSKSITAHTEQKGTNI